ncbi:hypothetical protein Pcac1_g29047 [Phytophthora cactorum]|nr:hypothetical protein Pcac1_g29047 [Phytophthora cactorum]
MGPDVDSSSCDDLLAFLESEMTNKEATVSRLHILEAVSLQFRLVGREEAITTAAKCFCDIIALSGTAATDRTKQAMPVCSGISGLGKTRMLEEGGTILQKMKLDPKHVVRVIVPYFNGFSSSQSSNRCQSRRLSRGGSCIDFSSTTIARFKFAEWFKLRLPRNGSKLTLSDAIKVIERKVRQRVQGREMLYLFLGIDEYQKDRKGAFLCSKSSNLVVLPMFAGTDLGVIASGSIANPSYYVTERLPMTLLTLDQVFTFVESHADFAGFLRQVQICRNFVQSWEVSHMGWF